jgi:hypothetical protein
MENSTTIIEKSKAAFDGYVAEEKRNGHTVSILNKVHFNAGFMQGYFEHSDKKFGVCIVLYREEDKNIKSQLYIVNSPSKEDALNFILNHDDMLEAKRLKFLIAHTKTVEVL